MLSDTVRVLEVVFEDPETTLSSFSGSITESLVHPKKLKKLAIYFLKTVIAGYLLATFVSPAVAERLKLTRKEAIAISFICGYAGIRIIAMVEKTLEKKFISQIGQIHPSSTDSKNNSGSGSGEG
jgi:hypothetical protein